MKGTMMGKKILLGIVGGLVLPIVVGCNSTLQPTQPQPAEPIPAPQIPTYQPGQPDPESTQQPSAPDPGNTSVNVRFMQDVFNQAMTTEERSRIQTGWRSVKGDDKLEEIYLKQFTQTINERGVIERNTGEPLTVDEARQFMEWTLTQQP